MKTLPLIPLLAVVCMLAACSNKDDMKAEIAKQQERNERIAADKPEEKPPETKPVDGADTPKKDEEVIPEPDPNKPEEVHQARKHAMMLKRYKEVVRFCEMGKIDEKSDQQARFGCALAACNLKEADKARTWVKGIEKALMDQAIKVCTPAGVTL